jgi:UDP-N-acetylglucosamine acyltransferase
LNVGDDDSYTSRVTATIHPTAIVSPNAQLGAGVTVGPFCVIEDNTRIGDNSHLGARVHICSGVTMGADCRVHSGAVIGDAPQVTAGAPRHSSVIIGNRCIIREGATVHRSMKEGQSTRIGDDCFLMVNTHVAHDCILGNRVILVNGALLAGHVTLEDNVILSGNSVVHQFCRLGKFSFLSGISAIVKDLPPFMIASGGRARVVGLNIVGLRRAGIPADRRLALKRAYHVLYKQGLNISQAVVELRKMNSTPELAALLEFIRASKRGITTAEVEPETESDED